MKQNNRVLLSFVLLSGLCGLSMAFTTVNPRTIPTPPPSIVTSTKPMDSSHKPLHLFNDNNDRGLKEDWSTLTKAFGNFVRHVGSSVADAVVQGGNKLKQLVTTPFHQAQEKETTDFRSIREASKTSTSSLFVDSDDEDMFRGIAGTDLFDPPMTDTLDPVLNQAVLLLQKDELTAALLGPSFQCGRPFFRNSRTTTVNGKTSTSSDAKFVVFGTMAQGVATVTSSDDNLVFMDLEVNDRLYRINVDSPSSSTTSFNRGQSFFQDPHPWAGDYYGYEEDFDEDDSVEAEILEGVRGSMPYRGSVLDAEILDKTVV
jgi:hypothetical protein